MKPNDNQNTSIVQFTLRLPKELNDYIYELSKKMGIAKNSIVLNELWNLKNKEL